jgi:hypothetical protein
MFVFRAFDTYVIKVLGRYLKENRRWLKHHTTFCVPQQAPGNICDFHVCLSMVVFGVQPNCNVCVSVFILFYYRCLWLNMHINLLLIHTSNFIVWQDYKTTFRNTAGSSLEHIIERLCMFIVLEVINLNGEFYYNIKE